MEGMKDTPDKYYDLACVDPPYGINVNHNMGRRKGDKKSNYKPAYWDSEPPKKDYFYQLFRISKNQIIWGANHFIEHINKNSSCWLAWDKKFSDLLSFAQFELAWTSFDGTCKKFEKDPTDENRIHATQKPIALYDWIFKNYAKQGDKILYTHVGSGSSRIAAHRAGLDFTGYEIDKEYWQAQEQRYNIFKSQLTIQF
jgi:site-specific DNA-methyltransferase (adenine-specific)